MAKMLYVLIFEVLQDVRDIYIRLAGETQRNPTSPKTTAASVCPVESSPFYL